MRGGDKSPPVHFLPAPAQRANTASAYPCRSPARRDVGSGGTPLDRHAPQRAISRPACRRGWRADRQRESRCDV